jgi:hypothetical protein
MNTSRLGPSTAAPPKVVAALSDLSAVCSLMVEFGGHRMRMLEVSVDRAPTDGTDPTVAFEYLLVSEDLDDRRILP